MVRASVVGLFVLACFYTLAIAKSFFVPVCAAGLLALILNPLDHRLRSLAVPRMASAALLVFGIVGITAFGLVSLSPSLADWSARAPDIVRQLNDMFQPVKDSLEAVEKATDTVEQAAGGPNADAPQEVVVRGPSILTGIAVTAPVIAFQFGLTIALTFFFLLEGHVIRRHLILLPAAHRRRLQIARIVADIQQHVATYLLFISLINACLGITAALVAYLAGLPNPLLWGFGMTVLNFIPFVGPAAMIVIVFIVGLVSFPTIAEALVAPAGFLVLNVIESQLVTPLVLGKRMLAGSLAIFAAVAFGGWLWGWSGR